MPIKHKARHLCGEIDEIPASTIYVVPTGFMYALGGRDIW